jgi:hypothetical protein
MAHLKIVNQRGNLPSELAIPTGSVFGLPSLPSFVGEPGLGSCSGSLTLSHKTLGTSQFLVPGGRY